MHLWVHRDGHANAKHLTSWFLQSCQRSASKTRLLHAGFQPAGTFARKPKRQTGGDLHGKMGTLELQMQALLARMHRHNAGIAARHAAIEQVEGMSLKQVRAQYAEAVNVSSEQKLEQISRGGTRRRICSRML